MRTYNLVYSATAGKVEIAPSGARGYVVFIVMSHDQASAQEVNLYDGDDNLISKFVISPENSPASVAYPKDRPLWFTNGLQIDTGAYCTANLSVVK